MGAAQQMLRESQRVNAAVRRRGDDATPGSKRGVAVIKDALHLEHLRWPRSVKSQRGHEALGGMLREEDALCPALVTIPASEQVVHLSLSISREENSALSWVNILFLCFLAHTPPFFTQLAIKSVKVMATM